MISRRVILVNSVGHRHLGTEGSPSPVISVGSVIAKLWINVTFRPFHIDRFLQPRPSLFSLDGRLIFDGNGRVNL